ncbi:hypothetical protein KEM52_004423 [Ascosphaera acerosa]|nr:hypothetical protein KEM52_004423 [Ascosphaera acerosa]
MDPADFDEEAFRKFFPSGFGRQDRGPDVSAQIDRTKRTETVKQQSSARSSASESPRRPSPQPTSIREGQRRDDGASPRRDDSDSDSDSDDSSDDTPEFPTSHDLTFRTHTKAVTTVTVDPAGARMLSGSADCTVKLYDFASMTPSTLRAFKSVEPSARKQSATASAAEAHPVHTVQFHPAAANQVLAITATAQPRVLDRDGDVLAEFAKGDMYLRDMRNTKGHISETTAGCWAPRDPHLCVTAGTDSTLRVWDINRPRAQRDVIVHTSRAPGSAGRSRMTAVAWAAGSEAEYIAGAALDGTLALWGVKKGFSRPTAEVRDAHPRDTWVSDIDASPDGRLLVTRAADGTIKLWDARKLKQPVSTTTAVAAGAKHAADYKVRFSPSGAHVLAGSEAGDLHVLNPATLRPELVTPVTPGSPLLVALWHERLNQIVTGSANGETHVLYSPETSRAGSGGLLVMSKAPKRRHIDDNPALTTDLSQGVAVEAGHAAAGGGMARSGQPRLGLTASGRSRDPRRPHLPAPTPFGRYAPDERHIRESIPLSSMRDEDPREALLKYAESAEKDPIFTKVYGQTQPKPVFAELSDEEGGEGGAEGDGQRKRVKR